MECINDLWIYDKRLNTFCKRMYMSIINPEYCIKKYGFSNPWFRKNEIIRPVLAAFCYYSVIILSIYLVLSVFISPVSAGQTMNSSLLVGNITDTSISFDVFYKTNVRATGATFDGVEIIGYDTQHNSSYIAKELEPNTTHTFCIYKDLINCETATTTNEGNSVSWITEFIWKFILMIMAIICLICAVKFASVIAFISFIFSYIGIIQTLNTVVKVHNIEFSTFIIGTIYVILMVASILVTFRKSD